MRATRKKIRSLRTARVSVMPRAQHLSFGGTSRQKNHLPQPGGRRGCGLPLPAAGWGSGVWSQSHRSNLLPFPMPVLRKSPILNKTSPLPFSRICPTALWLCKCLWKRQAYGMGGGRSQGWGTPLFLVLFLPVVSSCIIFFLELSRAAAHVWQVISPVPQLPPAAAALCSHSTTPRAWRRNDPLLHTSGEIWAWRILPSTGQRGEEMI